MSDVAPTEAFLKWILKIESPSLKYAAQALARNVIFAVDIPYPLIKLWKKYVESERKKPGEKTSKLGQRSLRMTPYFNE